MSLQTRGSTVRSEVQRVQDRTDSTGSDERTEPGFEDVRRQFQCYLYLADVHDTKSPEFNHYAFPLTVSPVVDVQTMKVTRIDHLPAGADFTATPPKPYTAPPVNEFTPEHQRLRTDLKPLHVVQPEGASFRVVEEEKDSGGAAIEWQKWRFRVGFNWREGPVLYNVTYDNRSVFHRVSLSDMNIPYADPRPPYHRKAAFDLGDAVGTQVQARSRADLAGCGNHGKRSAAGLRLSRLHLLSLFEHLQRQRRAGGTAELHMHPRARRRHWL